ncbi:hypothetical protein [Streptomyces sp. WAC01526]|uniref:hypothetical protein n=1 Tax=Streptomyces sp. WAC01526 TaxID=2588709 RepID=UPI0011DF1F66|nr:hypothetical protein [Streptomyces sp. WAC01526]
MPVLPNHVLVDLVRQGFGQLAQVVDVVRADRDRVNPGQAVGGEERGLGLRDREIRADGA